MWWTVGPNSPAPRTSASTFFVWTQFRLDGQALSLYALENDVIRAGFHEPRIHFALNCASVGCPRLLRSPFLGSRLKIQLADATPRILTRKAEN
ncbi:MAG: DUF547 domain-containing protein [Deltaproteobacteria bacterium]|nr:DUF547 domain-containing protein [Deltaproteobacteria bacterium]